MRKPSSKTDDGNDGSDDGNATSGTNTASGTDDRSRAGSGVGQQQRRDGSTGAAGAAGDGDGIDDAIPLGGDWDATFRNDPRRKRTSRARSRSGARADSRAAKAAEKDAALDGESVPREVSLGDLGKSKSKTSAKDSALVLEFLQEGWAIGFTAASMFFQDEDWKLGQDDASALAERTQAWFASLDAKSYAAVQKKIAKWQPGLSLGMGILAVVGPRIANTRAKRAKAKKPNGTSVDSPPQAQSRANGNGTGAPAPATATVFDLAQSPIANPAGSEPIPFHGRSVRLQDWDGLSSEVDDGSV